MDATDHIQDTLVRIDLAYEQGDRTHLSAEQCETLDRAMVQLMGGDAAAAHAVSLVLDRTIVMPVYRWDAAAAAVAKLARKAEKRGLPAPSLTEVSRETRGEGDDAQEWITARVLGSAPVMHGWSLTGTVVPAKDGVIAYGDCQAIDMRCDHCGLARRRHLCFVIEHEDGRTVQVGSTCVDEYLGADALAAWLITSELHEFVGSIGNGGGWDLDAYAAWLAEHPRAKERTVEIVRSPIPVRDFLAAVVAEVREHGYLSSKDAYARRDGSVATGRSVWQAVQSSEHTPTIDADYARADEIAAWIDTLARGEYNTYGDPTFPSALASALDSAAVDGVDLYSANTLAAGVPSYARHIARVAEQRERNNTYVDGKIGDKVSLTCTVTRVWGTWVTALTDDGRTLCWKVRVRPEVGSRFALTGKISKFSEFRGTLQTTLQGVKTKDA